jgi:hypothetical protein
MLRGGSGGRSGFVVGLTPIFLFLSGRFERPETIHSGKKRAPLHSVPVIFRRFRSRFPHRATVKRRRSAPAPRVDGSIVMDLSIRRIGNLLG